jgi:predicted N-acyltransferase
MRAAQTTYSHKLFASVAELDEESWNAVRGTTDENIYMDPRLIAAVEASMSDQAKFWHIIVYDDAGKGVACATFCKLRVDPLIFTGPPFDKVAAVARKVWPSFMFFDVLLCGLPVSAGQTNMCIVPDADARGVVEIIDGELMVLAAQENVRFALYKEFRSKDVENMDALIDLGYRRAYSVPMHMFEPRFPDFQSYCKALKSHYRNDIKRSEKKFQRGGFSVRRLMDQEEILAVYTPELHELYLAIVAKSETKLELLPLKFFHELTRRLPEQLSLTLVYKDDRVVGFAWEIYSDNFCHFLFCGLNYELNNSGDVYFNIMFASLDNALKAGVPKIHVGQTADTFKARLGCFQEDLFVYVRGIGRFWSWSLNVSFDVLFPAPPEVPSFNIYKSTVLAEWEAAAKES